MYALHRLCEQYARGVRPRVAGSLAESLFTHKTLFWGLVYDRVPRRVVGRYEVLRAVQGDDVNRGMCTAHEFVPYTCRRCLQLPPAAITYLKLCWDDTHWCPAHFHGNIYLCLEPPETLKMAASAEGRADFAPEDTFFDKTTAPTATKAPNTRLTGGHDLPDTGKRVYDRKSGEISFPWLFTSPHPSGNNLLFILIS
jgi:hypothetical protein